MASVGWKAAEAARQLELSEGAVSQYKSGLTTPSPRVLALLRTKALAAHAEKYPKREEAVIVRETPIERVGRSLGEIKQALLDAINWSPLISWASAGNARAFEDQGYNVEWFPTKCRDPHTYCLEVEGDSMEPKHLHGDVIFVMPTQEPRNGDLVIARTMDDEVFFKIYHWTGHKTDPVKLSSYNASIDDETRLPLYPVREFKRQHLRFIHPVHSVLRRYRKDG